MLRQVFQNRVPDNRVVISYSVLAVRIRSMFPVVNNRIKRRIVQLMQEVFQRSGALLSWVAKADLSQDFSDESRSGRWKPAAFILEVLHQVGTAAEVENQNEGRRGTAAARAAGSTVVPAECTFPQHQVVPVHPVLRLPDRLAWVGP